MEKEPLKVYCAGGVYNIIGEEAIYDDDHQSFCSQCGDQSLSYRIDSKNQDENIYKTKFCSKCDGVKFKPGPWGVTISSHGTEVKVCYSDGISEVLNKKYAHDFSSIDYVLHCNVKMNKIIELTKTNDKLEVLDQYFECKVCQIEKHIRTLKKTKDHC